MTCILIIVLGSLSIYTSVMVKEYIKQVEIKKKLVSSTMNQIALVKENIRQVKLRNMQLENKVEALKLDKEKWEALSKIYKVLLKWCKHVK